MRRHWTIPAGFRVVAGEEVWRTTMKLAVMAVAAVLLAAVGAAPPASSQGIPRGSYLSSCDNVGVRGNILIATCRRRGGGELRTALAGFPRCVGDIGNNNGVLQCVFPGGAQARGQVVAEPGLRPPPPAAPVPYAAPPPYREGERCRDLRRRAHELRERMERAVEPGYRARLDGQLREVYSQQWYAGCRYE